LIFTSCKKNTTIETNRTLPYQFIENKYVAGQLISSDTSTGTVIFNSDGNGFQQNRDSKEPTPITWNFQEQIVKISFDEDGTFSFQIEDSDVYIKKLKQIRSYTIGGKTHQFESILRLN
jgi:hypothetical protein